MTGERNRPGNPASSALNIRLLTDAVLIRWRWIAVIVAIVPLVVVVASRYYRPPFQASARLLIQENQNVNPFLGDMMVDLQVESRFPVVRSVLGSRTIVEGILRETGEIQEDSTPGEIDSRIGRFQDSVLIENSGGGVIAIDVEASSPEQAYNRIQAMMDALLEEMLRPQRESLDASVEFLSQQLTRMSAELTEAGSRLRQFKEEHADELPEVFEGNLERYLNTQSDLQQAQADLEVAEGQLSLSEEELSAYNVDPLLSELESDVVQARSRYEGLRDDYTDDHPRVIEARRRLQALEVALEQRRRNPPELSIDSLERQADARVEREPGEGPRLTAGDLMTGELLTHRAVRTEVESLRLRVARLEVQRDELRDAVASYAGSEQALNELVQDVEAKNNLYNDLLGRYQDSLLTRELTLQSESTRVWIIQAPTMPAEDNRIPIVAAGVRGLILALVLAGAVVFAAEYLDRTVRVPATAEAIASVPTVAVLPRQPNRGGIV